MSDENVVNVKEVDDEPKFDALDALKKKAKLMGVKHHHKIGIEKLTKLLEEKEAGTVDPAPVKEDPSRFDMQPAPTKITGRIGRRLTRREYLRKEAAKLVRIRVACMNPNKKEWEGEIYTVSNSVVGTFKKYVPFNNDEGWHVPNIIFQHMLERECQIFYTAKGPRGNKIRKGKLIKELVVEVLPDLTTKERKDLAIKQAMARGND